LCGVLCAREIHATVILMNMEDALVSAENNEEQHDLEGGGYLTVEPGMEEERSGERAGEEMLHQMEIADTRLDIEGKSRLGASWDTAVGWGKKGFDWAKKPSETYTEAVGKAALFSAATTVFLAPIFLYRNCKQVYDARREEEGGAQFAQA